MEQHKQSCNVQQYVLNKLVNITTPLLASELSKLIGIQKSTINVALYELERRCKVIKGAEMPPKWIYCHGDKHVVKEVEENIWNVLLHKECAMSSHSIAWELKESKGTINRILYGLEKDGKVERLQLSPPIWKAKNEIILNGTKRHEDTFGRSSSQEIVPAKNIPNMTLNISSIQVESKKRPLCSLYNIETTIQNKSARTSKSHHTLNQDVAPSFSEKISEAVWNSYCKNHSHSIESVQKDVILAGYVLKKESIDNLEVIALGTGTKMIAGDKFSLEGTAVHDCHAEVAARRSLIRWLYKQLFTAGMPDSYAIQSNNNKTPYELRPFELWMYSSQTPCGDAAIFCRGDPEPKCVPCFTTHNHGKFRLKQEASHGAYPRKVQIQSYDDWQLLGGQSTCHTCSDKIAKWSVVGVQGALLAQLIPPLYMTGIVIGDVFSHGHASRALCCRSERALAKFSTPCISSDSLYTLHHLQIGNCPLSTKRSKQISKKKGKSSINWALGDKEFEVLDGTTGRQINNGACSHISKTELFRNFLRLCKISSPEVTYKKCKANSKEYHHAVDVWKKAMCDMYGEPWVGKPSEVEDFKIS